MYFDGDVTLQYKFGIAELPALPLLLCGITECGVGG